MTRDLETIALAYVPRGWAVLPLHTPVEGKCSCQSKCSSPGKHPRIVGGLKNATKDQEIVKKEKKALINYNIELAITSMVKRHSCAKVRWFIIKYNTHEKNTRSKT